jgi:hypothetical protein
VLPIDSDSRTRLPQGKTPLLTKATGYEVGVRSEPVPNLKLEGALFVLNLDSEATFSGDEAVSTRGCALTAISPPRTPGSPMATTAPPIPSLAIRAATFRAPPT